MVSIRRWNSDDLASPGYDSKCASLSRPPPRILFPHPNCVLSGRQTSGSLTISFKPPTYIFLRISEKSSSTIIHCESENRGPFRRGFMGECSGRDSGVSPEPRSFLLVGPGKHRFSRYVGCWCCGESGKQLTSTGQVSYHREAVASGASMCIRLILKGLSSLGGIGTGEASGLIFLAEQNPDYQDFASFSFVVTMTCQVSDVNVSSRSMRRLTLLHGFLFLPSTRSFCSEHQHHFWLACELRRRAPAPDRP
jgi:hypothetical protein